MALLLLSIITGCLAGRANPSDGKEDLASMRAIWSDAGLTDGEKVENLKWLNEILHWVT